jgi:tryptophanyl-tRNA synthetase
VVVDRKRLFSGIQPSGEIHIGNYLGAIRKWVELLDEYDCIFCIVDYHAYTVPQDPATMQQRIFDAALVNMACGLKPGRCTLFVQSRVPEHTELAWILNTLTPLGVLERMTQFKEKSRRNEKNVNAGLLTYPVLQAADILLYRASVVPVGEDQAQHLELSRDLARKFNRTYGENFPEPTTILGEGARIMGLDGKAKMSKSLDNYIGMMDSPETVKKKLAPAFTDPARQRRDDPGNPDICNIFTLHKLFSPSKTVATVNTECRRAGIGCLDCKMMLHEHMTAAMAPIQECARELQAEPGKVYRMLEEGAERAGSLARATMDDTRRKMGLR